MAENFRRSFRGYSPADVDLAVSRLTMRTEQLEYELGNMTQRAQAMQVEIQELHARVDTMREREASLARSLDEMRARRDQMERESQARARQLLVDAEERAASVKMSGLRQVGELQRQVEQLVGMRAGLTRALQQLSDDLTGAIARITTASMSPPTPSETDEVEDHVAQWSEER
jgi:chromosome segregation ATPase